jgi:hypothetical protein
MRIRTGRQSPQPAPGGTEDPAETGMARVRSGDAGVAPAGPRVRMMRLALPALSEQQVGETTMLFHEFLEHLDRLGLCEVATHVSLGFERFRTMYEPPRED